MIIEVNDKKRVIKISLSFIVKIILLNVKFENYSEPAQCIQKKCLRKLL